MVKESLNGLTANVMKGNIKMIKSMDLEYFNGKMVVNMKDNGLMENNMVKELSLCQLANKKKEYGRMEKEFNGLMERKYRILEYNSTNYYFNFL